METRKRKYDALNKKEETNTEPYDLFNASFFEEASKAWRSNKVEFENGTFHYKCSYQKRRGSRYTQCQREVYEYDLITKKKPLLPNCNLLCKLHIYKKINQKIQ